MIPRLWEYQVELPARTIIHATAAVILGVLLITKIVILKFFRYFEEAMPQLGLGILLCTVLISFLSIPHAVRGTGLLSVSLDAESRARVTRVLSDIKFEEPVKVEELISDVGLKRGRDVLGQECVKCHDMRTILAKPRSGANWYRVIVRMLEKPSIFEKPLNPKDVPYVTAFMVSITPDIQESRKQKIAQAGDAKIAESNMDAQLVESTEAEMKVPELPPAQAKVLYEKRCIDCHKEKETIDHGGDTEVGWAHVVRQMIVEQEAEISAIEGIQISRYLALTFPVKTARASSPAVAKAQPAPAPIAPAASSAEAKSIVDMVAAVKSTGSVAPTKVATQPSTATETSPTVAAAAPAKAPAAAPAAYAGPSPCLATSFSTSSVRSACLRGGRAEASSLMRALVARGKAKDLDFKCSSCHVDRSSYGLTGNATADLRKLF